MAMPARVLDQSDELPLSLQDAQQDAPPAGRWTWRGSAPRAIRLAEPTRGDAARDGSPAWRAWQKLLRRKRILPGDATAPAATPLLWADSPETLDADSRGLIERLHGLSAAADPDPLWTAELKAWLAERTNGGGTLPNQGDALESLAWCRALPALAQQLAAEDWWELLRTLVDFAADAAGIDTHAAPLVNQLLAGELPLCLAWACREIEQCWNLRGSAHAALSQGLTILLDEQGLPVALPLEQLRPLLACWTRCGQLAGDLRKSAWKAAAAGRYRLALHNGLRFARANGEQLLAPGDRQTPAEHNTPRAMFLAALEIAGEPLDLALAAAALPLKLKAKRCASLAALPKRLRWPALNDEQAGLAVLRGGWDRRAPKLALHYAGAELHAELEVGGEVLFSGDWLPQIRRGGELLVAAGAWHCSCWVSDADGEYFEAELPLSGGARLQRQIMLARKDEILFAADAVLAEDETGGPPGELDYCWLMPLAAGVRFEPAIETREGQLVGRKPRAVVMPLALPEWRSDRRFGSLEAAPRGLELRQTARGGRLFAPLFFDLAPRRLEQDRTWRQLTVGRDLLPVPREDAVAYRVQIGKQQWTAYRSLAPVAGRSYLGQHTFYEFVLGRFNRKGKLKALIEIE